jgi:hypothetical protein
MLKGNKLKFQRGPAAKAEGQDRNHGGENRHHDGDGKVGPRKSPCLCQACRDLSKDRALSAQNGQLMLKSDKLEFERGAAAKAKIDTTAERIASMTVTVRPARENHQALSALWRF